MVGRTSYRADEVYPWSALRRRPMNTVSRAEGPPCAPSRSGCWADCRSTSTASPCAPSRATKERALLAYLAAEAERPHRRERLAGLLWPESSERLARNNLRHTLCTLRHALGDRVATPPFLLVERDQVQLNPQADWWVDVRTFRQLLGEFAGQQSGTPGAWSAAAPLYRAAELYRGDFLEGFSLPDSPVFEDWMRARQEELHSLAVGVFRLLAPAWEAGGGAPPDFARPLHPLHLGPAES